MLVAHYTVSLPSNHRSSLDFTPRLSEQWSILAFNNETFLFQFIKIHSTNSYKQPNSHVKCRLNNALIYASLFTMSQCTNASSSFSKFCICRSIDRRIASA